MVIGSINSMRTASVGLFAILLASAPCDSHPFFLPCGTRTGVADGISIRGGGGGSEAGNGFSGQFAFANAGSGGGGGGGGGGHKGAGSVVSAFVGGALSSEQVAMQVSSRVVGYSSSV